MTNLILPQDERHQCASSQCNGPGSPYSLRLQASFPLRGEGMRMELLEFCYIAFHERSCKSMTLILQRSSPFSSLPFFSLFLFANSIIIFMPLFQKEPDTKALIWRVMVDIPQTGQPLFIGHRFYTLNFVNRIMVLDQGQVAGYDVYKNLMTETEAILVK